MHVERINRGRKEFAVIPVEELRKLIDDAEILPEVKAYDATNTRIDRREDETIPLEITERRVAGESPVRIWREHRGLTLEKLAKKSKVSRGMIAAIEAGHKRGGTETLKKLAAALKVS